MEYTENYNLKKPEQTDSYTVNDFNENVDKIDEELKQLSDVKDELVKQAACKWYIDSSKEISFYGTTHPSHSPYANAPDYALGTRYLDVITGTPYDVTTGRNEFTWSPCESFKPMGDYVSSLEDYVSSMGDYVLLGQVTGTIGTEDETKISDTIDSFSTLIQSYRYLYLRIVHSGAGVTYATMFIPVELLGNGIRLEYGDVFGLLGNNGAISINGESAGDIFMHSFQIYGII